MILDTTHRIGLWALVPMIVIVILFVWMYRKIAIFCEHYIKAFIRRREKELNVKVSYQASRFLLEPKVVITGNASKSDKNKLLFQIFIRQIAILFTPLLLLLVALLLLVPKEIMNMKFR